MMPIYGQEVLVICDLYITDPAVHVVFKIYPISCKAVNHHILPSSKCVSLIIS